jgi:methionyl-tRNA formyltransferase
LVDKPRIVFLGSSDTAWSCCQALFDAGQDVAAVLSTPRVFNISWSQGPVTNVRFSSLEHLATSHGIPFVCVKARLDDPHYFDLLRRIEPDLLVVVGWYHKIPARVLTLPKLGTIGVHASLLPRYRGGAPLVWAMIRGESEIGVTLFFLTTDIDAGDIIGQERLTIGTAETIADVIPKANAASAELMRRYVPLIGTDRAPRTPQDHHQATTFPQRSPDDGLIDWSRSAGDLHNWVRAQSRPYPGAFTWLAGERIRIWQARSSSVVDASGAPGTLVLGDAPPGSFGVRCGDHGVLWVDVVGVGDRSISGSGFLDEYGLGEDAAFEVTPT